MTLITYILFLNLAMLLSWAEYSLFLLFMIISFFLFFYFDSYMFDYISIYSRMDMLSFVLIFLSLLIIYFMYLSEMKNMDYYFMFSFNFLLTFLIFSFSFDSLLMFYIFFESSLLPLMVLIILKGSTSERLSSSFYLLLYTISSSLPLLFCILYIYNIMGTVSFYFFFSSDVYISDYFLIAGFFAFFVKSPMYFFHLWLPKAHVEAPVTGSMILAGLLLKLGGYGMYRFNFMVNTDIYTDFCCLIWSISLMGGLIVSFLCLRQYDLKMLIAYSSVSHMSLVICSVMSLSFLSYASFTLMMIAHGLCSSCLFYITNMFYERSHSRNIFLLSGSSAIYPILMYFWFTFNVFSMSCPPSMNFYSEVLISVLMTKFSFLNIPLLLLFSLVSASYSLLMFTRIQHGKFWFMKNYILVSHKEYMVMMFHLLPLILYIFVLSLVVYCSIILINMVDCDSTDITLVLSNPLC